MKDLAKIKHFFKSLNFQKSIIDETNLRQNISAESFKEFEKAIVLIQEKDNQLQTIINQQHLQNLQNQQIQLNLW